MVIYSRGSGKRLNGSVNTVQGTVHMVLERYWVGGVWMSKSCAWPRQASIIRQNITILALYKQLGAMV